MWYMKNAYVSVPASHSMTLLPIRSIHIYVCTYVCYIRTHMHVRMYIHGCVHTYVCMYVRIAHNFCFRDFDKEKGLPHSQTCWGIPNPQQDHPTK